LELDSILFLLCAAPGVSGHESGAAETAAELLRQLCDSAETDALGNVVGKIGDGETPPVLLEAHLDQIGFVITAIEAEGFARITPCGGIDRRVLCGQEITLLGNEHVYGVIPADAPHLKDENAGKALPADAILVDTGLSQKDAALKLPLGSRAVFRTPPARLGKHRVAAPALDNRAGVCALLRCMELLQGRAHVPVNVLLAAQEETGGAGAAAAAFTAGAAEALVVDVSFAQGQGVSAPDAQGRLGGGAMVGFSPALDHRMSEQLCDLAERNSIAFTREIMGGRSGTDADRIQTAGRGVPCALLSIPLRNMHTPVEIVDLRDIEATAQLLAAYILAKGGEA
jgi:endoglucanase